MVGGNREHRPQKPGTRGRKPESDGTGNEEIEDSGHGEHAALGLGGRDRRLCARCDRSRAGGRCGRGRRGGRGILARVLLFEAADHEVRIDANRGRIRPCERAAEDATRPPRQIIRLESPQEGNRQLRLVGNRCQGNAAPFTFAAQPASKRGRLGHQLRIRASPAIAGVSEREYASAPQGWQADLEGLGSDPTSEERRRRHAFMGEEPALTGQAAAVADERPVRANHSMARHDQRHWIGSICGPDGPHRGLCADTACELAVRQSRAGGNRAKGVPDALLKRRAVSSTATESSTPRSPSK